MPPTAVPRRCLSIPFACALVLAAGACGGDDDASPPATSDPPTTTAPATTLSPTEEDEQALRQLTEDWYETLARIAVGDVDPDAAADYLTEDLLSDFVADAEEHRSSGRSVERGARSREVIEAVEVDGDQAKVRTCVVDADVLRDSGGATINDDTRTTRYTLSAAVAAKGWRFYGLEVGQQEEGDACAE